VYERHTFYGVWFKPDEMHSNMIMKMVSEKVRSESCIYGVLENLFKRLPGHEFALIAGVHNLIKEFKKQLGLYPAQAVILRRTTGIRKECNDLCIGSDMSS
jgi:hypothetical protein